MAATEVVKLTPETKRALELRKIHPRETIDDVIRRLAFDNLVFTPEPTTAGGNLRNNAERREGASPEAV